MRVISGIARGTVLYTLEGKNTRPTMDRVKEAMFNILQSKIYQAEVLDLFSGSGALGIEALSRGANRVTFCDYSHQAIKIINKNLEKTKMYAKSKVLIGDFKICLEKLQNERFDIIFLDPPYNSDFSIIALEKINSMKLLKKDGIIVIETDDEQKMQEELQKINANVYDLRKYGRVKLFFLN